MRIEHLEYRWHQLMRRQKAPTQYILPLWREISMAYRRPNRHYHTFHHLVELFNQADQFRTYIEDFDTFELSIWYHDIIYQCLRKDNEEKSAIFAKYRLEAIKYPREKIVRCYRQINATKLHQLTESLDSDAAWLLDFDLSILGSSWKDYLNYSQKVRKEYAIFPSFLYKRGRKKVLRQFLERKQLFHTPYYIDRYELPARQNLQRELELLTRIEGKRD